MEPSDVIIVGNTSDDPFAIDVAFTVGQSEDIADLISLKTFANTEFCPRFINDEADLSAIGSQLEGKTVVIVSTSSPTVRARTKSRLPRPSRPTIGNQSSPRQTGITPTYSPIRVKTFR